MEVAGICGTDVKMYGNPPSAAPVIMGHENIGVIAKAGLAIKSVGGKGVPDVIHASLMPWR